MTYKEIFEELKQLRNHLHGDFLIAEKQRIVELYRQILNKEVKNLNCADCYRDAFIELYNHVNRHKEDILEENHYALKEGEYIHFFGETEYWRNPIPDSVAKRYLMSYPSAISKFERYPEDWASDESKKVDDSKVKKRGRPKK